MFWYEKVSIIKTLDISQFSVVGLGITVTLEIVV